MAAANRATLAALAPGQQAPIDKAYQAALATLPDGPAKTDGIAVGEQATTAKLALCARDGFDTPESYRPHTAPGMLVPTVLPDIAHWPGRKPWLLASADQFRPGPPPSLTSAVWARDYNEIKALGAKQSTQRTADQTAIARFWEARVPTIYLPVVLSVATAPGREPTQNARLLAVATQAMDDALIAVADAKYHYNFWRPITAIRNGNLDGNDATEQGGLLGALHEYADAPRIPLSPLHPLGHGRDRVARGSGRWDHADVARDESHRARDGAQFDHDRGVHAGGGECAHLRRRALPHLHGSGQRHGAKDWRAGSCEVPTRRSSSSGKRGTLALEKKTGVQAWAYTSCRFCWRSSGRTTGLCRRLPASAALPLSGAAEPQRSAPAAQKKNPKRPRQIRCILST